MAATTQVRLLVGTYSGSLQGLRSDHGRNLCHLICKLASSERQRCSGKGSSLRALEHGANQVSREAHFDECAYLAFENAKQ